MTKNSKKSVKSTKSFELYRVLALLAIFAMAAALFTRPELQNLQTELMMMLISVILALIGAYGLRNGSTKGSQSEGISSEELQNFLLDLFRRWQAGNAGSENEGNQVKSEEKKNV